MHWRFCEWQHNFPYGFGYSYRYSKFSNVLKLGHSRVFYLYHCQIMTIASNLSVFCRSIEKYPNTSVLGHIHFVPPLFKIFLCSEHFVTLKCTRCRLNFSVTVTVTVCTTLVPFTDSLAHISEYMNTHLDWLNRTTAWSADGGKAFWWPPCIYISHTKRKIFM